MRGREGAVVQSATDPKILFLLLSPRLPKKADSPHTKIYLREYRKYKLFAPHLILKITLQFNCYFVQLTVVRILFVLTGLQRL